MNWTDIHDIAIALVDTYPDSNPLAMNFVDLRQKIIALDDFSEDADGCNEKILEAIQMAWLDECD